MNDPYTIADDPVAGWIDRLWNLEFVDDQKTGLNECLQPAYSVAAFRDSTNGMGASSALWML